MTQAKQHFTRYDTICNQCGKRVRGVNRVEHGIVVNMPCGHVAPIITMKAHR